MSPFAVALWALWSACQGASERQQVLKVPQIMSCMLSCFHRYFYASSACIYPEHKQLDTQVEGGGLKEADAWPAQVRQWVQTAGHVQHGIE